MLETERSEWPAKEDVMLQQLSDAWHGASHQETDYDELCRAYYTARWNHQHRVYRLNQVLYGSTISAALCSTTTINTATTATTTTTHHQQLPEHNNNTNNDVDMDDDDDDDDDLHYAAAAARNNIAHTTTISPRSPLQLMSANAVPPLQKKRSADGGDGEDLMWLTHCCQRVQKRHCQK